MTKKRQSVMESKFDLKRAVTVGVDGLLYVWGRVVHGSHPIVLVDSDVCWDTRVLKGDVK